MLRIPLRPSSILAAILVIAHGAAIAVVAVISMSWRFTLVAIAALSVNLLFHLARTALLRANSSVVALEIGADSTLNIQTRRGDWIKDCEVLGSTYVVSFLVILNLGEPDRRMRRHVVLLTDSVNAEDFRTLRVWLRWKRDAQPEQI